MYYIITTLSSVGYGDLYPMSNREKVLVIFLMFSGTGFFSYVLNAFTTIIRAPSPIYVIRTDGRTSAQTIEL